ncbi:MAG: PPOX class F420-dependent oxidoreductase [Solirubrobacteraceae bacterium]
MTDLDHPLLNEPVRYILDGPHLSVLATTDPDGKPQTSVIFVKRDGDHILFSTIEGRRKTINMRHDSRVNLLIHGLPVDRPNYAGDGPNYATITGTVELTDDPNGAFHQEMYDIHMGGATPPPEPGAQRVIARIVPQRIYVPTFPGPANAAGNADEQQARDL